MSIAGSFDAACRSAAKLPSACARSVAFCAYMSRAKRTFCWLDTKWLCQNSVIRSVSGEGVASISRTHQARSSIPSRTLRCWKARRSSTLAFSPRGARSGPESSAQAGGAVTACVRVSRRISVTACSRVRPANRRTSASVGPKPVRASRWRASS